MQRSLNRGLMVLALGASLGLGADVASGGRDKVKVKDKGPVKRRPKDCGRETLFCGQNVQVKRVQLATLVHLVTPVPGVPVQQGYNCNDTIVSVEVTGNWNASYLLLDLILADQTARHVSLTAAGEPTVPSPITAEVDDWFFRFNIKPEEYDEVGFNSVSDFNAVIDGLCVANPSDNTGTTPPASPLLHTTLQFTEHLGGCLYEFDGVVYSLTVTACPPFAAGTSITNAFPGLAFECTRR